MVGRRRVLVACLVPLIGCTDFQKGRDLERPDASPDLSAADQIAGVYVVLLEREYEGEPVTAFDDGRIADVDVIQVLIERATNPDVDLGTVEGSEYTYETTMIGDGDDFSGADLQQAVQGLHELPQGQHPNLDERGWYVRHPDQLLRFNYVEYD